MKDIIKNDDIDKLSKLKLNMYSDDIDLLIPAIKYDARDCFDYFLQDTPKNINLAYLCLALKHDRHYMFNCLLNKVQQITHRKSLAFETAIQCDRYKELKIMFEKIKYNLSTKKINKLILLSCTHNSTNSFSFLYEKYNSNFKCREYDLIEECLRNNSLDVFKILLENSNDNINIYIHYVISYDNPDAFTILTNHTDIIFPPINHYSTCIIRCKDLILSLVKTYSKPNLINALKYFILDANMIFAIIDTCKPNYRPKEMLKYAFTHTHDYNLILYFKSQCKRLLSNSDFKDLLVDILNNLNVYDRFTERFKISEQVHTLFFDKDNNFELECTKDILTLFSKKINYFSNHINILKFIVNKCTAEQIKNFTYILINEYYFSPIKTLFDLNKIPDVMHYDICYNIIKILSYRESTNAIKYFQDNNLISNEFLSTCIINKLNNKFPDLSIYGNKYALIKIINNKYLINRTSIIKLIMSKINNSYFTQDIIKECYHDFPLELKIKYKTIKI